jgi:hypothetical protein
MLSVGDVFAISHTGGLPHPATYRFFLLWEDGVPVDFAGFITS